MKKWSLKFLLYLALLLGWVLLYVVNVEELVYEQDDQPIKSKVDFVYQQF